MAQRISRFGVGQTAKVLAILYTIMGLIFMPFFFLATMSSPESQRLGVGFLVAMPILYGLFGYVFSALGCALYNAIAARVGGIEVELAGE